MNSPAPSTARCHVIGADKLPADIGGADSICAAIAHAAAQSPGPAFTVEVRVLGASSLAATLTTADGKVLPEQKMAVSDRVLGRDSIDRFAASLVGTVARAHKL